MKWLTGSFMSSLEQNDERLGVYLRKIWKVLELEVSQFL